MYLWRAVDREGAVCGGQFDMGPGPVEEVFPDRQLNCLIPQNSSLFRFENSLFNRLGNFRRDWRLSLQSTRQTPVEKRHKMAKVPVFSR